MELTLSVIVCAHNEAGYLGACLHSLLAQSRPPDEIIVINNDSSDATGDVAAAIAGVRVIDEPRRGLVVARETGRRAAAGDILVYVDADCRAPLQWLEKIERRFSKRASLIALSAPYRFYDWHARGRALIRAYDLVVAPATHAFVHHGLGIGAILYGGNFAVQSDALARIGGFDRRIEFHGEDTNLGRRLTTIGRVALCPDCWVWTSARRYRAMGKGAVFRVYVRNFWSEILRHRPADEHHLDVRA